MSSRTVPVGAVLWIVRSFRMKSVVLAIAIAFAKIGEIPAPLKTVLYFNSVTWPVRSYNSPE